MLKIVILLVAALAVVSAQDQVPQNCSAVTDGLNWNNTALFGTWLEVARNPVGNAACIEITVGLLPDNKTLNINATHSDSISSLYQNVDETTNVTLVEGQLTGYNVTLLTGNPVHIKLLKLVDEAYLVGCGYTNASDNSTSYGFIMARPNKYNATGVDSTNNLASPLYSNFQNNTYGNITQVNCYRSSAAQSLPLLSGVLALAMLLIKGY